jgi:hypothetical protein
MQRQTMLSAYAYEQKIVKGDVVNYSDFQDQARGLTKDFKRSIIRGKLLSDKSQMT